VVRKPDFFLIGAAKAGTSSLFQYLTQHPRVFIPPIKEIHFFADQPPPGKERTLEQYLELFRDCPEDVRAGDASTTSLHSLEAYRRIHEFRPDARIFAVLRNPIDRAYSWFWHNRRDFKEDLETFEEALAAEPDRARAGLLRFKYVEHGMYHRQLRPFFDAFGRDRVHVHLSEDLRRDPGAVCASIFSSLDIDNYPVDASGVYNRSGPPRSRTLSRLLFLPFPGRTRVLKRLPRLVRFARGKVVQFNVQSPPRMRPETRRRLAEVFREDVERLEELLERDLGHWLEQPASPPYQGGVSPGITLK
jgi:hypothetical protein